MASVYDDDAGKQLVQLLDAFDAFVWSRSFQEHHLETLMNDVMKNKEKKSANGIALDVLKMCKLDVKFKKKILKTLAANYIQIEMRVTKGDPKTLSKAFARAFQAFVREDAGLQCQPRGVETSFAQRLD